MTPDSPAARPTGETRCPPRRGPDTTEHDGVETSERIPSRSRLRRCSCSRFSVQPRPCSAYAASARRRAGTRTAPQRLRRREAPLPGRVLDAPTGTTFHVWPATAAKSPGGQEQGSPRGRRRTSPAAGRRGAWELCERSVEALLRGLECPARRTRSRTCLGAMRRREQSGTSGQHVGVTEFRARRDGRTCDRLRGGGRRRGLGEPGQSVFVRAPSTDCRSETTTTRGASSAIGLADDDSSEPPRADESRAEANQSIVATGSPGHTGAFRLCRSRVPGANSAAPPNGVPSAVDAAPGKCAPVCAHRAAGRPRRDYVPRRRRAWRDRHAQPSKTRRASSPADGSASARYSGVRTSRCDENGDEQPLDIVRLSMVASVDQCARTSGALECEGAADGGAEGDELERASCSNQIDDPSSEKLVEVDVLDGFLQCGQVVARRRPARATRAGALLAGLDDPDPLVGVG